VKAIGKYKNIIRLIIQLMVMKCAILIINLWKKIKECIWLMISFKGKENMFMY